MRTRKVSTQRRELLPIEKVKKLTVRVVVQDCTGTVRFTDVMLQGGSVATAWVSHVSEQRYTFDAQEV